MKSMMQLNKTEEFLKKFDYNYSRNNEELIVKMNFSHKIFINFSNPEKIIITDKLIGWNFLTGIINMNIKKAVLFNLFWGVILSFIIAFSDLKSGIFFFIALMIWVLLWFSFYISKSENLKQILIYWNN
jgi:hypothetical protein